MKLALPSNMTEDNLGLVGVRCLTSDEVDKDVFKELEASRGNVEEQYEADFLLPVMGSVYPMIFLPGTHCLGRDLTRLPQ